LVIPDHALGSPVLRSLSLCTCCRHCPGAAAGRTTSLIHPAVSAFPERVVGSACASSFSRFARRSLALRPAHSRGHLVVTRYPRGFSHFVISMTAPVASGWSVRRVGLAPTGKRRLSTAAHGLESRSSTQCFQWLMALCAFWCPVCVQFVKRTRRIPALVGPPSPRPRAHGLASANAVPST
jgi:hypothetical protein